MKLGARTCVAADIEEQAVAAARANLALNGLAARVTIVLGSLDAVPDGPYDFVFANINAGTVIRLAPGLFGRMRSRGRILAGGVIAEREPEVAAALAAAGLDVERVLSDGEWRTFVARKP